MDRRLESERAYSMETALLYRDLDLVGKLRAALDAAEDLEARGVSWDEAWRNNEDWQRLGRIALLLLDVRYATESAMSAERLAAWDERVQRRLAMQPVE
jgi:hypothetical protein